MANEQLKTLTLNDVSFDPNIAFIGMNPTNGDEANDTKALWVTLGTGWAYIGGGGQVHGQPTATGMIKSFVCENSETTTIVFQIWHSTSNNIYTRYGSTTTVDMPEWKQYAPIESPTFTGTPKAPTNTTYTTSNTQIATTAFTQGAINRRLPKNTYTKTIATFNVPTSTDVTKTIYTATANGVLIISGEACFASNATGRRVMALQKTTSGGSTSNLIRVTDAAAAGGAHYSNVSKVVALNDGDSVKAVYWQNSGSTLSVSAHNWQGYYITD